jgi:uncharacterized protein YutD
VFHGGDKGSHHCKKKMVFITSFCNAGCLYHLMKHRKKLKHFIVYEFPAGFNTVSYHSNYDNLNIYICTYSIDI